MRKGKLMAALVIIGVLAIPFSVFAAASDSDAAKAVRGFFGIDTSKLTTQQKSEAAGYSKKIADLQKEFIDKMVQNGTMTKEAGDAAKQGIDNAYKSSQDNSGIYGLTPGMRMGKGFDRQKGPGKNSFDASKLTDQQKADINATAKKIDDLYRAFIDTAVNDGLITKTQGDSVKSRLDAIQNARKDKTSGMAGLSGAGSFGLFGNDESKLTDQQKKDIADYTQKLSALRKELIDKYVAAGVITREQGDNMLKRTEQKPGHGFEKGPGKGMMKGKSFKNRSGQNDPDTSADPAPSAL